MSISRAHSATSPQFGFAHSQAVPELLTAKELEAILKIDVKTIYAYVQRGLIPYVRIQSNIRFAKAEILNWIEGQSYRPRPVRRNSSTGI